jgi:MerR family transcriptional regulator, redox-sensitive transcriptional activator SoxR
MATERSPVEATGLSIGMVARRTGISASTLRYYESAGLLTPPRRVHGRRVYDDGVFDALAIIRLAQRAGFSVADIRTLIRGFDRMTPASARWKALAQRKLDEVTAQIARAQEMQRLLDGLLHCPCDTLEECVRPRLVLLAKKQSRHAS